MACHLQGADADLGAAVIAHLHLLQMPEAPFQPDWEALLQSSKWAAHLRIIKLSRESKYNMHEA